MRTFTSMIGVAAVLGFGAHALAQQAPGTPPVPAGAPMPAPPAAVGPTGAPPPGPALNVINDRCSVCHSTATVFGQRRTAEDWGNTVQLMVDRGADLTPDDVNMVVDYLAKNYGPQDAKPGTH